MSLLILFHQKYLCIMLTVQLIPWWPSPLWNSKIIIINNFFRTFLSWDRKGKVSSSGSRTQIFVNFLGTTMVSSTEYLNLTVFLRMLFSSKVKLGSGFILISFTFLLQNLSCGTLSGVGWGSACLFWCRSWYWVPNWCCVFLLWCSQSHFQVTAGLLHKWCLGISHMSLALKLHLLPCSPCPGCTQTSC